MLNILYFTIFKLFTILKNLLILGGNILSIGMKKGNESYNYNYSVKFKDEDFTIVEWVDSLTTMLSQNEKLKRSFNNYGLVISVGDGIATIFGLNEEHNSFVILHCLIR